MDKEEEITVQEVDAALFTAMETALKWQQTALKHLNEFPKEKEETQKQIKILEQKRSKIIKQRDLLNTQMVKVNKDKDSTQEEIDKVSRLYFEKDKENKELFDQIQLLNQNLERQNDLFQRARSLVKMISERTGRICSFYWNWNNTENG